MWYTIREETCWIVRSSGSGCGIISVDQLVSIANNDSVGEVEDVIALVVTPAPEHKNWLIEVYLQLLLLFVVGNPRHCARPFGSCSVVAWPGDRDLRHEGARRRG